MAPMNPATAVTATLMAIRTEDTYQGRGDAHGIFKDHEYRDMQASLGNGLELLIPTVSTHTGKLANLFLCPSHVTSLWY